MNNKKANQVLEEELSKICAVVSPYARLKRIWPEARTAILSAVAEIDELHKVYKMELENKKK